MNSQVAKLLRDAEHCALTWINAVNDCASQYF
jgi:hypothetical protein